MPHKNITKALRSNCTLHAFRSGGGLRVIRVEKTGRKKLVGYGEHPNVREAIKLADGTLGLHEPMPSESEYLTGSDTAEDSLDEWLLNGLTFDGWLDGNEIVVRLLNRFHSDRCPTSILEEALRNGSAHWSHRGGVIKIYGVSCHCPNDHVFEKEFDKTHWSYSLKTIRENIRPWTYSIAKTGFGENFDDALENAVAAPEIEVKNEAVAA